MFGLFDPASLKVNDAVASIDFLGISDGVAETIEIRTPEHARRIAAAVRSQAQFGVTSLEGPMERVTGAMRFREGSLDEGVLKTSEGKVIPFKLGFTCAEGDLPIGGMTIAQGVMFDGALVIQRVAIEPPAPDLEIELLGRDTPSAVH